ncbi:hypothetical protein CICLE_v10003079mg [Citrus x clementina]|uniref:Uncharacterized protein n=1 Tax=Citrus clementina TaxID=85681 RepID=V4TA06_CITCL|nr:hypothetical protein CICLE_v10003079mg [Citrus x clementina]
MMLISWTTRIAEPPKTGLEFWKTLFLSPGKRICKSMA